MALSKHLRAYYLCEELACRVARSGVTRYSSSRERERPDVGHDQDQAPRGCAVALYIYI